VVLDFGIFSCDINDCTLSESDTVNSLIEVKGYSVLCEFFYIRNIAISIKNIVFL